ncbi:hypothetical protein NDU88_000089 [Pleurodeles waltl]|uniref:Uncharacterized protein n=1 Tax=Pleurodeles waltl TaxID=8319 RepID=A0AAV7KM41_PLEWA|nr:hypothetical protein NDU88_000089 [Pleurodeles waltl]
MNRIVTRPTLYFKKLAKLCHEKAMEAGAEEERLQTTPEKSRDRKVLRNAQTQKEAEQYDVISEREISGENTIREQEESGALSAEALIRIEGAAVVTSEDRNMDVACDKLDSQETLSHRSTTVKEREGPALPGAPRIAPRRGYHEKASPAVCVTSRTRTGVCPAPAVAALPLVPALRDPAAPGPLLAPPVPWHSRNATSESPPVTASPTSQQRADTPVRSALCTCSS